MGWCQLHQGRRIYRHVIQDGLDKNNMGNRQLQVKSQNDVSKALHKPSCKMHSVHTQKSFCFCTLCLSLRLNLRRFLKVPISGWMAPVRLLRKKFNFCHCVTLELEWTIRTSKKFDCERDILITSSSLRM